MGNWLASETGIYALLSGLGFMVWCAGYRAGYKAGYRNMESLTDRIDGLYLPGEAVCDDLGCDDPKEQDQARSG